MSQSLEIAVTNLSFRTTIDDIYQVFSKFGDLEACRLQLNERGESKGYAFLKYKRSRAGNDAINAMNRTRIDGREIFVAWSTSSVAAKSENNK